MYDDKVIFVEEDEDLLLEDLYYEYPTVERFTF